LAELGAMQRQPKITLGDMRASGVWGLLVACADDKCVRSVAISANQWPNDVRLSDLEPHFVCQVCGHGIGRKLKFDWCLPINPKNFVESVGTICMAIGVRDVNLPSIF